MVWNESEPGDDGAPRHDIQPQTPDAARSEFLRPTLSNWRP